MATRVEHMTPVKDGPAADDVHDVHDEPLRMIIPPAFYRDDEPPEPPEDDPHWREFPNFDGSMRGYHLLIVGIVVCVLFATFIHMLIILAVQP